MNLDWSYPNDVACRKLIDTVDHLVNKHFRDLVDLFPFRSVWSCKEHWTDSWYVMSVTASHGTSVGTLPWQTSFEDEELELITRKFAPHIGCSYSDAYRLLGEEWFSYYRFTYVGPCRERNLSWQHFSKFVVDWLNDKVLPQVYSLNLARVLRAIPEPPQIDPKSILDALWVLECESDNDFRQGTAFMLSDSRLITCSHVIGTETLAFQPNDLSSKYRVREIARNKELDLAVLQIEAVGVSHLKEGSADKVKLMDHLVIAGFPNFRLGDTGIIEPGLVIGFRTVAGVRRILTNAPIIAGNSGGPVLDRAHNVIGIAVTGADNMETAYETENHGVIPIDVLRYLK